MHDHAHHHHEMHAPATKIERRALWVALVLNGLMFFIEIWQGLRASSSALLADSGDFLSDAASYGITLLVLSRPLKVRALAGMAKGYMMLAVAALALIQGISHLLAQAVPEPAPMGAVAALALLVNLVCAALLFSTRNRDSNMRSIWLCSRNDAVNNVLVLIAAGLVAATGSLWPDLLAALFIAVLVGRSGFSVIKQARAELREEGHAHG